LSGKILGDYSLPAGGSGEKFLISPPAGGFITNDNFPSGHPSYGEHGIWMDEKFLELVEEAK